MPKLEFFLIAQSFAVDQNTDRLSIFEVLSDVYPRKLPAYIPRISAILECYFEKEEFGRDFQMSILVRRPIPPDELSPVRIDHNFTVESSGGRFFPTLVNFPIKVAGLHIFEILINGTHFAEHRLEVHPADDDVVDDGALIYPSESSKGERLKETLEAE